MGAFVTGRRTFDIANGWNGSPPLGVPTFVVTHTVLQEWDYEGSPFTCVTKGVESAVKQAKAVAGDKGVAVSAASIAQQCIRLGLLDEIHVDLVPVLLGGRRPVVRPPGHGTDRPGTHEGGRGPRGNPPHVPCRKVR
jgi:dihydrofolate reductase